MSDMIVAGQQTFDYTALDPETRIVVQQEDKEFDRNMADAGTSFLRACHNIKKIHEALHYKRPGFVEWCSSKAGLKRQTAYRMLDVAGMFPESGNISIESKEALYLLAAPSTPEAARDEALARAAQGEAITHRAAKAIVETHRPAGGGAANGRSRGAAAPARRTAEREEEAPECEEVPPAIARVAPAPAGRRTVERRADVLDGRGEPVPELLRDVFADTTLPEETAAVRGWLEALRHEQLLRHLSRKISAFPYLHYGRIAELLRDAHDGLHAALDLLEAGAPYAPCPACGGRRCAECRNGGHVPRWRYEELLAQGLPEGAA